MTNAITIAVGLFGAGMIGTGAYYHFYSRKMHSDPVLIAVCYLIGGLSLAACFV